MLVLFCDNISQRLIYTLSIVFDVVYKADYKLTDDKNEFLQHQGAKLSYSSEIFDGVPGIIPSEFLNDGSVIEGKPLHGTYNDITHLFPNEGAFLPFDVFASIFFMVSRYEEYGNFKPDQHGRFPLEQSLAHTLGIHKKAIAHHWCKQLADLLNQYYPDLVTNQKTYQFEVGMDIDNAFAYKHKNPFRTVGALIRSVLNPGEYAERLAVLTGNQKDPYDNYEYIFTTLSRHKTALKLFFLCARYGPYDKNISPSSKAFKKLVSVAQKYGEIGIHPSYSSNKNSTLENELKTLNKLSGNNIQSSRQHYLMIRFPTTYDALLKAGIKNDYSMGYAESAGFRAGMAMPYPFYHLKDEKTTDLIIHPFAFMESCYIHYQSLESDQIKSEISSMMDEVKSVNGVFHAVWHNEYLGGKHEEKWKEIFEFMLNQGSTL